jgi:hypothetical protein
MDNVTVRVSSALVSPKSARRLAKALIAEEPMIVWVPSFTDNEVDDEYVRGEKKEFAPWLVCPSGETKLDEHDPFGSPTANIRPRIARTYASTTGLRAIDRFGREWQNGQGAVAIRAVAWGRKERDDDSGHDSGPYPGLRLSCSKSTLKRILTRHKKDLLILINLQRYQKSSLHDGKYTHTVAVVRLGKSLKPEYHKGSVNRLHVSRY